MPTNHHRRNFRCKSITGALVASALVAVTLSSSGCATMHANADAPPSLKPDWSNAVPAPNSELSGLSNTSRQIERNLGYE